MMVMVTYQALSRVSRFSLTAKALCATVGCLATIGRCILIKKLYTVYNDETAAKDQNEILLVCLRSLNVHYAVTLPGSQLPAALHGLHLHSSIALALLEW